MISLITVQNSGYTDWLQILQIMTEKSLKFSNLFVQVHAAKIRLLLMIKFSTAVNPWFFFFQGSYFILKIQKHGINAAHWIAELKY